MTELFDLCTVVNEIHFNQVQQRTSQYFICLNIMTLSSTLFSYSNLLLKTQAGMPTQHKPCIWRQKYRRTQIHWHRIKPFKETWMEMDSWSCCELKILTVVHYCHWNSTTHLANTIIWEKHRVILNTVHGRTDEVSFIALRCSLLFIPNFVDCGHRH